ncbi:MAG: IS1595 family transposase [Actinomycetota bacterium]|nr:IS1595 family transposase [Actinomycetota bacterium]
MGEISVISLADKIETDADAYRFLEELRWGDKPVCPHCGRDDRCHFLQPKNGVSRKTRTGAASQRRVWFCGACRKQFSALTGTIFHGSKVSVRKWLFVFFEVCSSKNGVAAREIERKYDVTAKTAWFMLHRIREAMKRDPLAGMMKGTIVADETWIGGDPKNWHESRRRREGDRTMAPVRPGRDVGNMKTKKTPVFSLVDKATGEVRSRVVPDVSGASLRKAMAEQVDVAGSHLETDSLKSYKGIGKEFASHQAIDHKAGEYVRGTVSTNMLEGYFSQLKRSIDGTHHHVSVEHLPRYLAEFDYRYTTRKLSDTARLRTLMGQVGDRRLTYQPIVTGRG